MEEYVNWLNEIRENFASEKSIPSQSIKESPIIKKIFSYILTIGNMLNGGTNRGQADGFNIEIIKTLSEVKGNKRKNLLEFIDNLEIYEFIIPYSS